MIRVIILLIVFFCEFKEIFAQSLQFSFADTIVTNLSSELRKQDFITNSNDSIIYYIDKTEFDLSKKRHLTINIIRLTDKKRFYIKLNGIDVDIVKANYLLITPSQIVLSLADSNLFVFDVKGNFKKKVSKPYGAFNVAFLSASNRLIFIDYYFYHILDNKPLLKLLSFDLEKLKFDYKAEYEFPGIQYTIHNSKYFANNEKYFFIATPLSNKIFQYSAKLELIDSFQVKSFNTNSSELLNFLEIQNKKHIKEFDSLNNIGKSLHFLHSYFSNNKFLQAKFIFEYLSEKDSLIDRIQKVNVFGNRLFIIKKMKNYSKRESNIDVFDIDTKEHLIVDKYFNSKKEIIKPRDLFTYCLQCTSEMNSIFIKNRIHTYQLFDNNYFPVYFISKEIYNKDFDEWLQNNKPYYMIVLYKIDFF